MINEKLCYKPKKKLKKNPLKFFLLLLIFFKYKVSGWGVPYINITAKEYPDYKYRPRKKMKTSPGCPVATPPKQKVRRLMGYKQIINQFSILITSFFSTLFVSPYHLISSPLFLSLTPSSRLTTYQHPPPPTQLTV